VKFEGAADRNQWTSAGVVWDNLKENISDSDLIFVFNVSDHQLISYDTSELNALNF